MGLEIKFIAMWKIVINRVNHRRSRCRLGRVHLPSSQRRRVNSNNFWVPNSNSILVWTIDAAHVPSYQASWTVKRARLKRIRPILFRKRKLRSSTRNKTRHSQFLQAHLWVVPARQSKPPKKKLPIQISSFPAKSILQTKQCWVRSSHPSSCRIS